jgi:hypothetical protein
MNGVDVLLKCAENYEQRCLEALATIRKLPNGRYRVLSEKGKNLGTYKSRPEAVSRLKMIEMFKHMDDKNEADDSNSIDLTDIDDFALSAIMRKLNEKTTSEIAKEFLAIFKHHFDTAVKKGITKPDRIALQKTVLEFDKLHKIRFDKKMVKMAAISELGNAEQVGRYLSDIVRFTLQRISPDKRTAAIARLKNKFNALSEIEIASKQLPESSALGQAITFVKHVLFNHDAVYIRNVLNSLVKSL